MSGLRWTLDEMATGEEDRSGSSGEWTVYVTVLTRGQGGDREVR